MGEQLRLGRGAHLARLMTVGMSLSRGTMLGMPQRSLKVTAEGTCRIHVHEAPAMNISIYRWRASISLPDLTLAPCSNLFDLIRVLFRRQCAGRGEQPAGSKSISS